ncbi:MAG: translation initiation factor, partial [Haliea sp.]|nr:translation initiation factor [Haliea sp.]
LIRGLAVSPAELKVLAKALKQKCGVGGSVKEDAIEIQGDQRETLKTELERQGFVVKIAGG